MSDDGSKDPPKGTDNASTSDSDGNDSGRTSPNVKPVAQENTSLAKSKTLGKSSGATAMDSDSETADEEKGYPRRVRFNIRKEKTDLSIRESETSDGEASESKAYETFEHRASIEFDEVFKGMQVWSRFQAEMHLTEAAWFESKCFYMEIIAAFLGTLSLTSVMASVVNWIPGGEGTDAMWTRLSIAGFVGVAIAWFLHFFGSGSAKLLPTFHKRADDHRKAAFSWQHLKHDIKAVRLQLRDPARDIREVFSEYTQFTVRRMQLSEMILVSLGTIANWTKRPDQKDIEKHELQFLINWPIKNVQRITEAREVAEDQIADESLFELIQDPVASHKGRDVQRMNSMEYSLRENAISLY